MLTHASLESKFRWTVDSASVGQDTQVREKLSGTITVQLQNHLNYDSFYLRRDVLRKNATFVGKCDVNWRTECSLIVAFRTRKSKFTNSI